ncbi:class I SAM-dependent methyltransferase [Nafulsella turpanensis]|uniref:class I SAM-dependent methyltransferase n=1 Tax=Nafulsella turpanensis TaxID=1265690 RepID=UPI00034A6621|nr:class I SAM-dependent methyltransferase [Nafulsella turpanensis]
MEQPKTEFKCRICGNSRNNEWFRTREMMYGLRDEFWYIQCSACKCLQIKEIPADMSRYYPGQYYSHKLYDPYKFKGFGGEIKKLKIKAAVFQNTPLQKGIRILFLRDQYKFLQELEVSRESRILDVGSGNGGKFLYPLAEIGFKNVMGCDPYLDKPIKYENGLEIKKTDIFGISGKWDLITFHHSYEHIGNPVETMEEVAELLAPGATCIVRIPTVSSYAWQHFKTDWFQLDAPRHFFLHSIESMKIIAEKAGLELSRVWYDSTHSQFSESEKYQKDIPLLTPQPTGLRQYVKRKIIKKRYKRLAEKLNQQQQGDQAAFFFRKAERA